MNFPNPSIDNLGYAPQFHIAQYTFTSLAPQTWLPAIPERDNPLWLPETLHHRSVYMATERGIQYDLIFERSDGSKLTLEYSPVRDYTWSGPWGYDRDGDTRFNCSERNSTARIYGPDGSFGTWGNAENTDHIAIYGGAFGRHIIPPFYLTDSFVGVWLQRKREGGSPVGHIFLCVKSQTILRKSIHEDN